MKKIKPDKKCLNCRKFFTVTNKHPHVKFCSRVCSGGFSKGKPNGRKGVKFSKEHSNNISKSLTKYWSTHERIVNPSTIEVMRKRMIGNRYRRGKSMPKSALIKLSVINTGSGNANWRGGKIFDKSGYVLIWTNTHPFRGSRNYIREHRAVLENHLKRHLTNKEVVHHINCKKDDNRLKNLILFNGHSAHTRFEHGGKIYNKEIIFDGRKTKENKNA